jgi:hypothetical protein
VAPLGLRALAATLFLSCVLVGAALAQGTTPRDLSAMLSGNGNGVASVTLNPDAGTVCYSMAYNLAPPATAAHIHRGEAGTNGPIVVPFFTSTPAASDSPSGCTPRVDAGLIRELMSNQAGFYVNIHNADFPGGAIRGQLGVPLP